MSTVRSMARGEFITRTPRSSSRCSASTRKMICSSEPGRNDAGEHRVGPVQLGRRRSGGPERPPTDAVSPSYGTIVPAVPARLERAGQLPRVPALSGGEDDECMDLSP